MKVFRLIPALIPAVLLSAGCRTVESALKSVDTGCYYRTGVEGTELYFCVDDKDDRSASGHYYAITDKAVAPRQEFSARVAGKKRIALTAEDFSKKIKRSELHWNRYVEPEFAPLNTELFSSRCCNVDEIRDINFANVKGYWSSLPGVEADVSKALTDGLFKSFRKRDLKLELDIYVPEGIDTPKPLILFIHGGAFYVGDKQESAYIDFCRRFAAMGYVTASMNYRLGFHLGKGEIERAAYMALQDANAALRYLVSNSGKYGINPDLIFVAGSSAGSITALNLAFMTEDDSPDSAHGGEGLFKKEDLGGIDESGNDIDAKFSIKAVANMWGAVSSLDMLSNSRTDIISFHGNADEIVPYAEGYPFSKAGRLVSKGLSEKMYGSICIDSVARKLGLRSELYIFEGEGHALNTTGKEKKTNENHELICARIKDFFFKEMVPVKAKIVKSEDGTYKLNVEASGVQWKADGGFIVESGNEARILWREDEREHTVHACGTYSCGAGFVSQSQM